MHADAPGEFDIIARYFTRPSSRADVPLGVGDDAAVLAVPPGRLLVAAMDTIVEGVHFPETMSPRDIGHRVMAVNLSDLAAMGAEPAWALLSLSMPHADEAWIAECAAGLFALADRFNVALVGGDTVRGPLVLTVQVLGLIERDRVLTRGGARVGDAIFVSGIPGEAAAGLDIIQSRRAEDGDAPEHLRERFLKPEPRVALGRGLRAVASAAMDVSDGLLTDLHKLCAASGCAAQLDLDCLPRSAAMEHLFDPVACLGFALGGGDDYELLFTVPPDRIHEIEEKSRGVVPCTRIGQVVEVSTVPGRVECFRDGVPVKVDVRGYDHFART